MEQCLSHVQLIHDDFRNVDLEDNSIDLIFCDPPYLKKNIALYGDLGLFAKNKLKDGGSLVCYIGHYNLPDYLNLLGEHLTYWWIFAIKLQRPGFPMNGRKVVPRFKPLLWYVKGKYTGDYIYDHIESKYEGKDLHVWQQSTIEARHIINRLTKENDIVCDPFLGSGTTGIVALDLKREFIGIEKELETYNVAKERIETGNVQMKLMTKY